MSASELEERLHVAPQAIERLDAEVSIVERGAHPDRPERNYTGSLSFRSPEKLHYRVDEVSTPPPGWPRNDIEVAVDESVAWRAVPKGCPIGEMPTCLRQADVEGLVGRPPFGEGWAAPLDLIVPVETLDGVGASARTVGDRIIVTTTVARSSRLLELITQQGAFRQFHADDPVEIGLDAATLTLRSVSVRVGTTPARRQWASTWGYDDRPDDVIFDVRVDPIDDPGPLVLPRRPRSARRRIRRRADGARSAGVGDAAGIPAVSPGLTWTRRRRGRGGGLGRRPLVDRRSGVEDHVGGAAIARGGHPRSEHRVRRSVGERGARRRRRPASPDHRIVVDRTTDRPCTRPASGRRHRAAGRARA
ncbi:MAG: hypothetical protein R2695_12460 [Acidimicrobiales bacterium]